MRTLFTLFIIFQLNIGFGQDKFDVSAVAKFQKEYETIVKRKEAILKSIQEQNALTPELDKKIQQSLDLQELEDFYLPYKKKKRTTGFKNNF